MAKTHGPLRACAPIEALDGSMYSFVVSKVHTPSVAKLPDSKCFREALVASFHLTSCSFVKTALVHFSVRHHHVEIQPSILSILRLAAAQHLGMACANHWIYVKVKKGKISVFIINFYNTLYVYAFSV